MTVQAPDRATCRRCWPRSTGWRRPRARRSGTASLSTLEAIEAARADTPADYYSSRSPEPTDAPTPVDAGRRTPRPSIVLFSDGENTERPGPGAAAQLAADRGHPDRHVGVGTTEGADPRPRRVPVQSAARRGHAPPDRGPSPRARTRALRRRPGRARLRPSSRARSWPHGGAGADRARRGARAAAAARGQALSLARTGRRAVTLLWAELLVAAPARPGAARPLRVGPAPAPAAGRALLERVAAPRRGPAAAPLAAPRAVRAARRRRRGHRRRAPAAGRGARACPRTRRRSCSPSTCRGACAPTTSTRPGCAPRRTRRSAFVESLPAGTEIGIVAFSSLRGDHPAADRPAGRPAGLDREPHDRPRHRDRQRHPHRRSTRSRPSTPTSRPRTSTAGPASRPRPSCRARTRRRSSSS